MIFNTNSHKIDYQLFTAVPPQIFAITTMVQHMNVIMVVTIMFLVAKVAKVTSHSETLCAVRGAAWKVQKKPKQQYEQQTNQREGSLKLENF